MLANTTLILCDVPIPINKIPKSRMLAQNMNFKTQFLKISPNSRFLRPCTYTTQGFQKKSLLRIRQGFTRVKNSEDTNVERTTSSENELRDNGTSPGGGDWTTSALLFLLWVGLMYYVFNLTPNQTPSRDMYFLEKLLNLRGEDGFRMNQVLVALWYIMGLWPLVYSMLLLPAGRSSKGKVPVWPFLVLSCFGGAYVLLPYFVLWRPPPPSVEESELGRWPLNFLESKLTAGISLAAGLGLLVYAGLADGNDWKEFFQYFRESKFIHLTSIDFSLLSTFAPFWVYNDMSIRKWSDKGFWLLPISLIPLLGPALYLLLRPSIAPVPASARPSSSEQE